MYYCEFKGCTAGPFSLGAISQCMVCLAYLCSAHFGQGDEDGRCAGCIEDGRLPEDDPEGY